MDPLVLTFLLAIILVGGGIGVLADYLGRKFGKKRLRIFNLRPKHTARIGTFLVGVIISATTILVVFAASSDVRQWIIQGRKSIELNKILVKQVSDRANQITALDNQVAKLNSYVSRDQALVTKSKVQLVTANNQVKVTQQKVSLAQSKVNLYLKKLLAVQFKLRGIQGQLVVNQASLKASRTILTSVKSSYAELEKERTQDFQENRTLTTDNQTLTNKLTALNDQIKSITTQSTSLLAQRDQLKVQVDDAEAQYQTTQENLMSADNDLNNARQKYKASQEILQDTASATLTHPVLFGIGQELTRMPLDQGLTAEQARQAVLDMIQASSDIAKARGAGKFEGTSYYADFVSRSPVAGITLSPEQQIDQVTRAITGNPSPIVLISTALLNSYEPEPVPIDMHPFNNPLVFHKGQVLGQVHVGRDWSVSQTVLQLNDFVNDVVEKKAKSANMIPIVGKDGPVIQLNPLNTLATVNEIIHIQSATSVQAVVTKDTHASDVLEFEFRVK